MGGQRTLCALLLVVPAALIFCEYVLYYLVIAQCEWPVVTGSERPPLRALILGDPHLVGFTTGKWIDRLRREWQMRRSFQTAVQLLRPDVVFILGDIFDEGKYCSDEEWEQTFQRYQSIFHTPNDVPIVPVVGNHDVGFHRAPDVGHVHGMSPAKVARYEKSFGPSVQHRVIGGVDFVLVNSMALEDACELCAGARAALNIATANMSARPVLMLHFPLYRASERACLVTDARRLHDNTPGRDVVGQNASQQLLTMLRPRFVFSAHMHHHCAVRHADVPEVTVSTFNWRNRQDPSFVLATIADETPHGPVWHASAKELRFSHGGVDTVTCHVPHEGTVFVVYGVLGAVVALGLLLLALRHCCRPPPRPKAE